MTHVPSATLVLVLLLFRAPGSVAGLAADTLVRAPGGPRPVAACAPGDRVAAPRSGDPEAVARAVATWRSVRLRSAPSSSSGRSIALLRPLDWMQAHGARLGAGVWVGAGPGAGEELLVVVDVDVPPRLAPPPGSLVIGHRTEVAHDTLALRVGEAAAPLRVTRAQPVFSETARRWVPAGELRRGDLLRTRSGPTRLVERREMPGAVAVHALEVLPGEAVWVGRSGVLVQASVPGDLP